MIKHLSCFLAMNLLVFNAFAMEVCDLMQMAQHNAIKDEYYKHLLHGATDVYFQKLKNPDIQITVAQRDLMNDIIRITENITKNKGSGDAT